ncbi:hypothetical protein PHPALM_30916 [Phytophthora palmivora]|uniref:PiggyBac transposable element-derived protein domain-containing protein n=1 Tax=Phytophthora palmivora TaxID=4796 RepID=A0A2P4X3X1_9STRA|nr:hypothetical protein PHPALM_30916 [Phytophthora palmivora]
MTITHVSEKFPQHLQMPYLPPMTIANNAGDIAFRDKNTVVFYTMIYWEPFHSVCCLEPPSRQFRSAAGWRLFRAGHWIALCIVPAVIVAYNLSMNGVDLVNQLRNANPIRRKEKRLSVSILTWVLDLVLINAYSLFEKIAGPKGKRVTLRHFKQRVAEKLTTVPRVRLAKERRRELVTNETITDVAGADNSLHAITPNSKRRLTGKLTFFEDSQGKLFWMHRLPSGVHMTCFSSFHYREALSATSLTVRSALDAVCAAASGDPVAYTRPKKNKTMTYLDELGLPYIIAYNMSWYLLMKCLIYAEALAERGPKPASGVCCR